MVDERRTSRVRAARRARKERAEARRRDEERWKLNWEHPDKRIGDNFNETKKAGGRFHPIKAVLPFLHAITAAITALLAFSFGGWVGAAIFVLVAALFLQRRTPLSRFSLPQVAIAVAVGLWALGLDQAVMLVLIGSLAIAFLQLADYYFTEFSLTDRRIYMTSGFITRQTDTLPLRALTDMRYEQTPLGKFLNYGHFYVESAGQDQALSTLRYVPQPNIFYGSVLGEALGGAAPPPMPAQPEPPPEPPVPTEPATVISLEDLKADLPFRHEPPTEGFPDDHGQTIPPI